MVHEDKFGFDKNQFCLRWGTLQALQCVATLYPVSCFINIFTQPGMRSDKNPGTNCLAGPVLSSDVAVFSYSCLSVRKETGSIYVILNRLICVNPLKALYGFRDKKRWIVEMLNIMLYICICVCVCVCVSGVQGLGHVLAVGYGRVLHLASPKTSFARL